MKRLISFALVAILLLTIVPLTVNAANESEPNESFSSATAIALNTNHVGALSDEEDEDWYSFTLTEKGSVKISFKHESINTNSPRWEIYLYSSDGSTHIDGGSGLWSVPGNKDIQTAEIGLDAGTYYVRVKHWNSSWVISSNYTLRVSFTASLKFETEINNTHQTADEIGNNVFVYGSISSTGDEDWYKFTLTEKGYISIWFAHPEADTSNTRWEVYLYNSDASTSVDGGECYWSIPGDENIQTAEIGVEAGTYYVRVKAWNDSWVVDSTYTLDVYFTASDEYETEQNNSYANADALPIIGSIKGSVSTSKDADWYKLVLPVEGEVSLSLLHPIENESNPRWTVQLYRGDGYSRLNVWNVPVTSNLKTEKLSLSAGTYYVQVIPWSNSWVVDTTYTLTTEFIHDCYGEWVVTEEASCEKIGKREKYCEVCKSLIEKEDIPKAEHSCSAWTVTEEGDCTTDKIETGVCGDCGAYVERITKAPGHKYNKTVVTPPTCTDEGYTTYICDCSHSYDGDFVKAVPHTEGEWVTVTEPEVGKDGLKEKRCTVCKGLLEEDSIPALEPEYILGDVNGNGEIEKYDYILVKRAVLKTVSLNETQQKAANVNGKDGVDKYDYILVKRHVLKTYTIEQ